MREVGHGAGGKYREKLVTYRHIAGIVGDVENGFAGGPVESFPAQRHSCGAEKECPQAAPQAFDLCRCPT